MGTAEQPTPKRRWRPRFSLLTLVLGVLFVGACGGLWWRWEPWAVLFELPATETTGCLAFSNNGVFFAECDDYGNVRVWNLKQMAIISQWHNSGTFAGPVAVSPDGGSLIASESDDPNTDAFHMATWTIPSASRMATIPLDPNWAGEVPVWSADGKQIFLCNDGLDCYDADTGRRRFCLHPNPRAKDHTLVEADRPMVDLEHSGRVVVETCLADFLDSMSGPDRQCGFRVNASVSADGQLMSTSICGTRRMQIWQVSTGKHVCTLEFPGHLEPRSGAVFSPDGTRIAVKLEGSSGESACVQIWSVSSGQRTATLEQLQDLTQYQASFSSDGKRFFCYSSLPSKDVQLWDADTGKALNLVGTRRLLVVVSPDGSRAVDCTRNSSCIIDATTNLELFRLPHGGPVIFSPDSQGFFASTGSDQTGYWSRRRPEYWWGIAWLPEFWVAYFSGGALLVIAARRLRARKAAKQEAA